MAGLPAGSRHTFRRGDAAVLKVVRRPYFAQVESLPGLDAAAWEEALSLWALGMARCLALDALPEADRSETGGRDGA